MNSFVIKIKNIGKSFSNFFKINPHKHWVYLLYGFFTLIFLSVVFSIYFLYQIKNSKLFQVKVEQAEKQNILKEDLLKRTIDYYGVKFKQELDIKNNPSPYKDPSI